MNFAHGAFFALGAYFTLALLEQFGWPAVILAPLLVGLFGILVERLPIRRLYDKDPLVSLIVTFALALLIEAGTRVIWGGLAQPFSRRHSCPAFFLWGPMLITRYRFAVFAITVALLVGLWVFMQFTPYGRILRAGSRDPEMVGLLGIRLPIVLTAAFDLGCCLAGIAGLLAAPLWTVYPAMQEGAIMPAFVVATIGGLGSFAGAVIAGLLVG